MFAIITVALISGAIADRAQVRHLDACSSAIWVDARLLPGRALGVRVRRRHRRYGGWIANKLQAIDFAGGTAVHINAGAAGLALALVLGKRHRLPTRPDAPAQPAVRHARRRPAVVRLVRLQRRLGARRQRHGRPTFVNTRWPTACRDARLAVRRSGSATATPPRWAPHRARRRPGRDHPVVLFGDAARCDRARRRRRRALRAGGRPEVPVRLRRLARRRRRPPGRRSRRHPADRLPRHRRRPAPASTACSTAAASTSCGARRSALSRCCFSVIGTLIIAYDRRSSHGPAAQTRRTRHWHRRSGARGDRHTTSGRSGTGSVTRPRTSAEEG